MNGVSTKEIEKARELDLLTYLRTNNPGELVHLGGENYSTRTHDSLKISNGKWMWFSRGIGGCSALDYLIKVEGYEFIEAVRHLNGQEVIREPPAFKVKERKERKLILPHKSYTNNEVIKYLTGRGIDKDIIKDCIDKGILFESYPQHHAVFLGLDENNIPRYAMHRSTGGDKTLGDCSGSDKAYGFRIMNEGSNSVHIFESAIDLLSYQTLLKMQGEDYKKDNYLSLAGVYSKGMHSKAKIPAALETVFAMCPGINEVHLHLDNDKAGRLATVALEEVLVERVKVFDEPPPYKKDVNDYLKSRREREVKKEMER